MEWLRRLFGGKPDKRVRGPIVGWNAFIDRQCGRGYDQVDPPYLPAVLVFYYFNEVYNGGHFQFFLNREKDTSFDQLAAALRDVGGIETEMNFTGALEVWKKWNPKRPETVEEYLETEKEEDLGRYDSFVYRMNPPIENRLETYLMERKLI